MKAKDINIANVVHNCTLNVKVTGLKKFGIRLKVGGWIIKLGCKVIGCGIKWEDDSNG